MPSGDTIAREFQRFLASAGRTRGREPARFREAGPPHEDAGPGPAPYFSAAGQMIRKSHVEQAAYDGVGSKPCDEDALGDLQ